MQSTRNTLSEPSFFEGATPVFSLKDFKDVPLITITHLRPSDEPQNPHDIFNFTSRWTFKDAALLIKSVEKVGENWELISEKYFQRKKSPAECEKKFHRPAYSLKVKTPIEKSYSLTGKEKRI